MSHNDSTPDQGGTGAGGSSSYGGQGVPEYGQRTEGAPSGPSYEAPRYGQGGDQYSAPQYGQGRQPDQQGYPGQHGAQDQYGSQHPYGQGQYGNQYGGQDPYGQGQYGNQYGGQDPYGQGQYGGPGHPAQYQQGRGYPGQYDTGQYGGGSKPAGTGLGIAALILGIVALLTCWIVLGLVPGLVGLVLGIVALRKLGRTPGASKALPIIGIVLSVLGILASILFLVLYGAVFDTILNGECSRFLETNDQMGFQQCIEQQMGAGTLDQ